MTKEEAIVALHAGKVMTHHSFCPFESVRVDPDQPNDYYVDERDNRISIQSFWANRNSDYWNNHWDIKYSSIFL